MQLATYTKHILYNISRHIDTLNKQALAPRASFSTVIVIVIFFLQYLLFRQYIFREVLPVHPTAHDQVLFLNQAFEIYKALQEFDLAKMRHIVGSLHNGIALQFITAWFYIFLGPGRDLALSVNFLFFVVVELYFFRFSKLFFRSLSGFFCGVGLLLLLPTIYYATGGMFDFRLDFAAFCLNLAVLLEILILLYKKDKYSVVLLSFFLTLLFYTRTNLVVIYTFFLCILIFVYFFRKQIGLLKPLLASFVVAYFLVLPFIALNAENLYKYYFEGHVIGKEKEYRKAESNTFSRIDELLYYPKTVYEYHIQEKNFLFYVFQFVILILAIIAGIKWKLRKKGGTISNLLHQLQLLNGKWLLVISLLYGFAFLTIYTADEAKSIVVGMNLTIPIIVFLSTLFFLCFNALSKNKLILLYALLIFVIGSSYYFKKMNSRLGLVSDQKYRNIVRLSRDINEIVKTNDIQEPTIATFYNNELSDRLLMYYYAYDNNEWRVFRMTLGNSLEPLVGKEGINKARKAVSDSNILLYNVGEWPADWIPSNHTYKVARDGTTDLMTQFCKVGDLYDLPWGQLALYIRPTISLDTSGDWLLDTFSIRFNTKENCMANANTFQTVSLIGINSRKDLKRINLIARYLKNNKVFGEKQLIFINEKEMYEFMIPSRYNNQTPETIQIQSYDYMIPSKISGSKDTRKLLIFKPETAQLQ